MLGVFDSGVGGLAAFRELRRLLPFEDMIYLADTENAPYGTKTEDELLALVREDVRKLRELGAERILMACCTASTVWKRLDVDERKIALPIIDAAAEAALKRTDGHIAVIATNHTTASHAFGDAIAKIAYKNANPPPRVTEIAAQELVSLVERGERDGALSPQGRGTVGRMAKKISETHADTLILGCTHFSHLEYELSSRLCGVKIISAAREGAHALYDIIKNEKDRRTEHGITVYI